jgi:hypothetical protein
MSFKNNYRVRKRESESMATLGGAATRINWCVYWYFKLVFLKSQLVLKNFFYIK